MNPSQIQQKILYGYAKAGIKLGAYFSLYRSSTPINPIASGNLIGNIRMSPSVNWEYNKANTYGNNQFNACIDARRSNSPFSARVGDFLIPAVDPDSGVIELDNRFFVQSLQFDLPPRVVECNETISIVRPTQTTGVGNLGYVGYTKASSITIVSGMPCAFLLQSSGGQADTKLPTDTRVANWTIYLPNLGNVFIRNNDIIIDSDNQEFAIYENENTDLGWRLRAVQIVNYR